MKRKFCGLLCLCMLCTSLLTGVSAAEPAKAQIDYTPESFSQTLERQDDGSFVITTVRKLEQPTVRTSLAYGEDVEYYEIESRYSTRLFDSDSAANGSFVCSRIEYAIRNQTMIVTMFASQWSRANSIGTFSGRSANYYGAFSGGMPTASHNNGDYVSYAYPNRAVPTGKTIYLNTMATYSASGTSEILTATASLFNNVT